MAEWKNGWIKRWLMNKITKLMDNGYMDDWMSNRHVVGWTDRWKNNWMNDGQSMMNIGCWMCMHPAWMDGWRNGWGDDEETIYWMMCRYVAGWMNRHCFLICFVQSFWTMFVAAIVICE